MKHSRSIRKQYLQAKYLFGLLLLVIALLVVLFLTNRTVVAPQDESETTNLEQDAIENDWRCPANAWINCDPEAEETSKYCDPEYISWAQKSCEGFQGITN